MLFRYLILPALFIIFQWDVPFAIQTEFEGDIGFLGLAVHLVRSFHAFLASLLHADVQGLCMGVETLHAGQMHGFRAQLLHALSRDS